MNTMPSLAEALDGQAYSPVNVIALLKTNDRLRIAFESPVASFRVTDLEYHTVLVMRQYDTYFANATIPIAKGLFRLILALHDIGKPDALRDGDKSLQYKYTSNIISDEIIGHVPFSNADILLCAAIVCGDPIGSYLRGREEVNETAKYIYEMSQTCPQLSKNDFLYLLTVYYQCDVGSYTRDAFDEIKFFVQKDDIERIFMKDRFGNKIFYEKSGLLAFSTEVQFKYDRLLHTYSEIAKG